MTDRESRTLRMGALPPRYAFLLNPHPNEAFTRCPRCKATTRVRKMALVIHVDSVGLVDITPRHWSRKSDGPSERRHQVRE